MTQLATRDAIRRVVRPRRLKDVVASQLAAVLESDLGRSAPAAALWDVFELLTEASLDRPAVPPFAGLSAINADGLPFQFVFRFGADLSGFGFLCESGEPGTDVRTRAGESLRLAARAGELAHGRACQALEPLAAILLPADGEEWPRHWRSAVWTGIATARGAIVVKPYFNLNRGTCRERWLRAGQVLLALGRQKSLERLCELSGPCSAESWPVGLALDIGPGGRLGRVKIYFRSGAVGADWLARWYAEAGQKPSFPIVRRALELLGPEHQRIPRGGLVLSAEFHADEQLSLKIDFAVTKWPNGDRSIIEATGALAAGLSVRRGLVSDAFRAIHAAEPCRDETPACRFVGLGTEPDDSCHINLYLEPPLTAGRRAMRKTSRPPLDTAIRRGMDALLAKQHNGHWQDFRLPVGASDAWVTAYVLANLAPLKRSFPAAAAASALDWLQALRTPHGGWGYNRDVPNDADSTAWALIAFRIWNRAQPAAARNFLLGCGSAAEGFATYPAEAAPRPGWALPAADVTAVARRALDLPPAAVGTDSDGGLTRAYWWASPLYVAAMSVLAGARIEPTLADLLQRYEPCGAFERALLLICALESGSAPQPLADALQDEQLPDGSWTGAARLRLTHHDVSAPHAIIDSGTLFRDVNGVFTTATVLNALARYDMSRGDQV